MDTSHAVDEIVDEIAADIGPHLLSTRDAAKALNVSERTMQDWRLRACGPQYVRISASAVKYRPRVLARWIAEREVSSTSDPGPGDA